MSIKEILILICINKIHIRQKRQIIDICQKVSKNLTLKILSLK